jgi:hypothetical protein
MTLINNSACNNCCLPHVNTHIYATVTYLTVTQGQQGASPYTLLWDVHSLTTVRRLQCSQLKCAIVAVAFSSSSSSGSDSSSTSNGALLAAAAGSGGVATTITVWNWEVSVFIADAVVFICTDSMRMLQYCMLVSPHRRFSCGEQLA